MPQLEPLDWAPQLIWLVLTFGILYLLMLKVALPRIGSVLDMRRAHIARDIDTAETLRRETEEAIAAYEQAIAEAKLKAQNIAQEGRAKLNEEIATERVKLDRQLAAKSKEAEARIDEAKASALKEVNKVAADVAADIVQRLIGVTPSGSELAKAVEAARKE